MTITGTKLPDNKTTKIQSITFAKSTCTVKTATATSIQCVLDKNPTCGSHIPAVTTFKGNVANAKTVKAKEIACTITSATPSTALNILGEDTITFTGTNFPHELVGNTFELNFDNTGKTKCTPTKTKSTELVCLTGSFSASSDLNKEYGLVITINGLKVTYDKKFKTNKDVQATKSLDPTSASPVIKTRITIELN